MSRLFEEILRKRKFSESFLKPVYQSEVGKYQGELPDLQVAVERIERAVSKGETVLVYGDYDVDGVTASALMIDALEQAGAKKVEVMLPNRFIDGYGMSKRCVDKAVEVGATLVVTVDCGTNNSAVIEELSKKGIDTVVTDHHEMMGELPKAVAVVNPKRKDAKESGFRDLAGVGVAFMVARGLVERGLIANGQEKWLLDLVLIGTICDSMEMTEVNRELCYYGMIVLEKTRRVGLRELMRVAKVERINAHAIGYVIGPRLNAGGRMESAETSLGLLTTKSKAEAAELAQKLEELNTRRKGEQDRALDEIEEAVGFEREDRTQDLGGDRVEAEHRGVDGVGGGAKVQDVKAWASGDVIVVQGKWHEGVLGIIAGKIVEKYHKPAFVLAEADLRDEDGDGILDGTATEVEMEQKDIDRDGMVDETKVILKGSGRTFGEFNLAEALGYCKSEIVKGGGHAGACGVTVAGDKLGEFAKKVNEYYKKCKLKNQERFLNVQEDVVIENVGEISVELIDEIAQLEPFGRGNEEPIFRLKQAYVTGVRQMGSAGQHLRVDVQAEQGPAIKLVAFGAPEEWFKILQGDRRDFLVRLEKNTWRGKTEVEGALIAVE